MSGTYVEFRLSDDSTWNMEAYMERLGLPMPRHGFHATTVYSRIPISYVPVNLPSMAFNCFADGLLLLQSKLGLCLCLSVNCDALWRSHNSALRLGATWDFPEYLPHITLAYDLPLESLIGVRLEVPRFPLHFAKPEIVLELDETGKPKRISEQREA